MSLKDDWLKARKGGLGGSDIGKMYSLEHGCRRALFYDKTDLVQDYPEETSAALERGTLLEPVARKLYELRTGRATKLSQQIRHDQYPHMTVNPDAIIRAAEREKPGYLEIKCVDKFVFRKFRKEGLRQGYILQMQHGLYVMGLTWGSFAVLCLDPWQFAPFDVEADPELQGQLIMDEAAFWQIVKDNGPIPDKLEKMDSRCFKCPWRRTCRYEELKQVEAIDVGEIPSKPEYLPLVQEWQELVGIANEAEELAEPIKETIRKLIDKAAGFSVPGGRVIVSRWDESRWDNKALSAILAKANELLANPDIIEPDQEILEKILSLFQSFVLAKKPKQEKSKMQYYPTGD